MYECMYVLLVHEFNIHQPLSFPWTTPGNQTEHLLETARQRACFSLMVDGHWTWLAGDLLWKQRQNNYQYSTWMYRHTYVKLHVCTHVHTYMYTTKEMNGSILEKTAKKLEKKLKNLYITTTAGANIDRAPSTMVCSALVE